MLRLSRLQNGGDIVIWFLVGWFLADIEQGVAIGLVRGIQRRWRRKTENPSPPYLTKEQYDEFRAAAKIRCRCECWACVAAHGRAV